MIFVGEFLVIIMNINVVVETVFIMVISELPDYINSAAINNHRLWKYIDINNCRQVINRNSVPKILMTSQAAIMSVVVSVAKPRDYDYFDIIGLPCRRSYINN